LAGLAHEPLPDRIASFADSGMAIESSGIVCSAKLTDIHRHGLSP
jgi:hypothetical protein